MNWTSNLILLICTVTLSKVTSQETPVQTQTNSGTIEGYLKTVEDNQVEVYQGIPYAEPPTGNGRFKKPSNKEPWTGVLETKKMGFSCMQGDSGAPIYPGEVRWLIKEKQDEDCLTLNIWNPQDKPENASVMVFIHGGTFVRGASNIGMYNGETLAAFGRVIVVSLNYRVGVFGFLYLGTKSAPGNQGLLDQKMAIEWVKENIGYFGGDPSSITLFGHSAGGMSVTAHLFSPESRPLFKRAIVQSGSLNAPDVLLKRKQSLQHTFKIMEDAGCKSGNSRSEALRCLKQYNATLLSQLQMKQYVGSVLPFAPTIDGSILPDAPLKMLSEGNYGDQDILIGNVANEGTYLLPGDPLGVFNDQHVVPLPRFILHSLYDLIGANLAHDQVQAIKYEYTDWAADISMNNQGLLADALGDRTFLCPCVEFAKNFNKNSVYYYYFTQRTNSSLWGEWMGVVHRAELEYVFGFPRDLKYNYTTEERALSARIMQYFTDFAKYGNPSPVNGTWPLYTEATPEYMILNAEERGTGIGPRPKQCALWNWLLPSMVKSPMFSTSIGLRPQQRALWTWLLPSLIIKNNLM